ncbi:MAG: helix-turn-helix transcriptional regulator [Acidaminococcaceae bacterium]|nr:helix-turn-helix transcriptional regulator [Acidaminococcaceae bacterium]
MSLWNYIEKRMADLGLTRRDLEFKHDIAYATIARLRAGSVNITAGTKQKLALALQCSIGDINDAIYDRKPQEETEGPSVMETVDKLEEMVQDEHPDSEPDPEPPEKVKIIKQDPPKPIKRKKAVIYPRPDPPAENAEKTTREKLVHPYAQKQKSELPKERWPAEKPQEEAAPEPVKNNPPMMILPEDVYHKQMEAVRREAVAEYKNELKNACLQSLASATAIINTTETAYSRIGRALLAKLLEEDTGVQ